MKPNNSSQPKALNKNALKLHSTRVLVALLSYQLVFQPVTALAENFRVEGGGAHAPNNQRPFVDGARNGVPVVNINTPNNKGLSHNTYNHFNVSNKGLLLNNSATNVSTELAGFIEGNANLRTGSEASVILNEVVGATRSQLNGYIEVAGQRADVIVANPNGISCNGCGFVNTDRGVLTTGSANFNSDGSLKGFRTTKGNIEIQANGLDGSGQKRIDILAKAVKVYGKVKAQGTLNIATGDNSVDYATGKVTKHSDSQASSVGLDVSNLGGMYANQINLQVTDKGAGVNMQGGELIAIDQISLTADGNVELAGTNIESKTSTINVKAHNLTAKSLNANKTKFLANKTITVNAQNNLNAVQARFETDEKLLLSATNILTFDNVFASSASSDAEQSLNVDAGYISIINNSELVAKGALKINAMALNGYYKISDSVFNSTGPLALTSKDEGQLVNSELNADKNISIQAKSLTATNSKLNTKDKLAINAQTATISQSELNADQSIEVTSTSLNLNKANAKSASYITVKASQMLFENDSQLVAGTYITLGKSAALPSHTVTVDNSVVQAEQKLDINTGTFKATSSAQLNTKQNLSLIADQIDIDKNSILIAQGNLSLKSDTDSARSLSLDNSTLQSKQSLSVETGNIDLQNSAKLSAAKSINLTASNKLSINQNAAKSLVEIEAIEKSTLKAASIEAKQFNIVSEGEAKLEITGDVLIDDALIKTEQNLSVTGQNITLQNNTRQANADKQGALVTNGQLLLQASADLVVDNSVLSSGDANTATQGTVLTGNNIHVRNQSQLISKKSLKLKTTATNGKLDVVDSTINSSKNVLLDSAGSLTLNDSQLNAAERADLQAVLLATVEESRVSSLHDMKLNAANVKLDKASFDTRKNLIIETSNNLGRIDADGVNLRADQDLTLNSQLTSIGAINSDSDNLSTLTAGADLNLNTHSAKSTLVLKWADLDARGAFTSYADDLTLLDTTLVTNGDITFDSHSGTSLSAQRVLLNSAGKIELENGDITFSDDSVLTAYQGITLQGKKIDLRDTYLTSKTNADSSVPTRISSGDIDVNSEGKLDLNSVKIAAQKDAKLLANEITIAQSSIGAGNNLTLAKQQSSPAAMQNAASLEITNSKLVAANGNLGLAANTLVINSEFEKDANGQVIRDADGNPSTPSTQLWAGSNINLQTQSFINNGGLLWAAQNINIDRDGQGARADLVRNKEGAFVASRGDLNIKATKVDNISKTPTVSKDFINRTWEKTLEQSITDVFGDTNKLIKPNFLSGNSVTADQQSAYLALLRYLMDGTALTAQSKALLKADVVDEDGNVLDNFKNTWNKLSAKAQEKGIDNYNDYLVGLLKRTIQREVVVPEVPATATTPMIPATTRIDTITVVDASGNVSAEFEDELLALWLATISGQDIPASSLALIEDANKNSGKLVNSVENNLNFVRSVTKSGYTVKYFLTADKLNGDGFMARMVAGNNIDIDTDTFNNEHANLSAGNSINIVADSSITNKAFGASQVIVEVHKKGCFTCHTGKMGYDDTFGGKIEAKGGIFLNVAIGNLNNVVQDSSDNASKLDSLLAQANGESGTTRAHLDETHDERTSQAAQITNKKENQATLTTKSEQVSQSQREAQSNNNQQSVEAARQTLAEVTKEAAINALNSENSELAKAVLENINNAETAQLITIDGVIIDIPLVLLESIKDQIDTSQVPLSEYKNYLLETRFTFTDYKTFLSSSFMAGRLGNHREMRDEFVGRGFDNLNLQSDQFVDPLGGGWSGLNAYIGRENALNRTNWQARLQRGLKRNNQMVEHSDFIGEALATAMQNGGVSAQQFTTNSTAIYGSGAGRAIHQGGALLSATQIDLNINGDVTLQGKLNAGEQLAIAAKGDLNSDAVLKAQGNLALQGSNVNQTGGAIAGDNVSITAQQNANLVGTRLSAENALTLEAGNDVNIRSQLIESEGTRGTRQWKSARRIASEVTAGSSATIKAGRDVTLAGSELSAEQEISVDAGRDLNLIAQTETKQIHQDTRVESQTQTLAQNPNARTTVTETQVRGTQTVQNAASLNSGGNLQINTGRDVNLTASKLNSGGDIKVQADGAINIKSAVAKRNVTTNVQQGSKYTDSTRLTTDKHGNRVRVSQTAELVQFSKDNISEQVQAGSQIAASGNISFSSGKDTTISASEIAAGGDLAINSQGDINILAGQNQVNTSSKKGGVSESSQQNTAAISVLQSLGGIAFAGAKDINIEGAAIEAINQLDVTAAGNVNISAVKQQKNNQKVVTRNYTRTNHSSKHGDSIYTVTTVDRSSSATTDHKGASLKSDGINISSGKSITATAANIDSVKKLTLSAGENVNLLAVQNTSRSYNGAGQTSATTQQGTSLQSKTDIEITALRDVNVQSSNINAEQDINIAAANNILVTSEQETSNSKRNYRNTYNNNMTQSGSEIIAGGNTSLFAQQNIGIEGSLIDSKDKTSLRADKNVVLSSAEEFRTSGYSYKKRSGFMGHRKKSIKHSEEYLTHQAATLSGDNGVEIVSGANTQIVASDVISAKGNINIATGGELQQLAQLDKTRIQHSKKKSSAWGLVKKDHSLDKVNHSANGSISEAMGNVALRSGGSTRLQASEIKAASVSITAGVDTQGNLVNPNAKIYLDSITEFSSLRESIFDSSGLKFVSIDKGFEKTQQAQTTIDTQTLALKAAAGINVSVGVAPEGSLEQSMDKLVAEPGMEWLKTLKQRDDVNWQAIETEFKDWHYEQSGVSPLASLIIAIAVGVAMGPMGAELIGGTGGVAAGSGTIGSAVGSGAIGVAVEAGALSLATTASVSLINNNGDIGAVFKELGSSDNIKSLITSMVTAGLANEALSKLKLGNVSVDNSFKQNAIISIKTNLVNNTIRAGVTTVVQGGKLSDNLKQALRNSAANALTESVAVEIGGAYKEAINDGKSPLEFVTHKIAHAALGCVAGEFSNGDCGSAALGGAIGEIVGEVYFSQSNAEEFADALKGELAEEDINSLSTAERNALLKRKRLQIAAWKEKGVNISKLAAGLAATLGDKDVNLAANSAEIAVENNICGTGACAAAVFLFMAALEVIDKALILKDAIELADLVNECNRGSQSACNQAEDTAIETGVITGAELAIGSFVPGSRIGLEIANKLREKVDPDDLEKLDAAFDDNYTSGSKGTEGITKVEYFNANNVRFSQNSVSYNKKDRITGEKYTYDDLVESMRKDGWKGDPVDVVKMPDGLPTSMDNTRILAAREAGVDVKANVRSFDEQLTPEMKQARGWQDYNTWGEAITARINKQTGGFSGKNPSGATGEPKVKGKK